MADFSALKTAIQNAIKQNGNEEITGNLLQDVLLAIVTTLGDGSINNLISALNTESNARQLGDSTLQSNINTVTSAITAINYAIANGCVYAGIATPTGTPATGRVFYLALTAGTYTNYGNKVVTQGINILRYNGSAWSLDVIASIDDAPAPSSNNLIKSGGAFDFVMKNGSAFDLSAYNNGTTYADLNAALTALNALPAAYKKGGMSMKFVQTYDNNYIQARLMANAFTTDITKWQIVDEIPVVGSKNLVESGGVFRKLNGIASTNLLVYSNTAYGFDGNKKSADGWYCTDLIFLSDIYDYGNGIKINNGSLTSSTGLSIATICFYSINKEFISYLTGNYNTGSVIAAADIPNNAIYISFTSYGNTPLTIFGLGVNPIYDLVKVIDKEPTFNSKHFVESGGVSQKVNEIIGSDLLVFRNTAYGFDGKRKTVTDFHCTDLISLSDIYHYTNGIKIDSGFVTPSTGLTVAAICFYNSNKEFVGYFNHNYNANDVIDASIIPNNASYIAFSCYGTLPLIIYGLGTVAIYNLLNIIDKEPLLNSKHLVYSGGVYKNIDGLHRTLMSSLLVYSDTAYGFDGNRKTAVDWYCTELILLSDILDKANGIKIYSGKADGAVGASIATVCFYNSNKEFISYIYGQYNAGDSISLSDIPSGATYISLSSYGNEPLTIYGMGLIPVYDNLKVYNSLELESLSREIRQKKYIVWSQWNVGQFGGGLGHSTITPLNYNSRVVAWNKEVTYEFANVFGMVEYNPIFGEKTAGNNVSPDDVVWDKFDYKAVFRQEPEVVNYYGGNAINSMFPLSNARKVKYECLEGIVAPDPETQNFIDHVVFYTLADMEFMGVTIKVIECIAPFNFTTRSDNTYQRMAYQELADKFKNEPFVIIGGDMECVNNEDYNIFTNEGFTLCNGGAFGWFETCPTSTLPTRALDNIIVKGFNVKSVIMSDSPLSDHYPLIAALEPYLPEPTE